MDAQRPGRGDGGVERGPALAGGGHGQLARTAADLQRYGSAPMPRPMTIPSPGNEWQGCEQIELIWFGGRSWMHDAGAPLVEVNDVARRCIAGHRPHPVRSPKAGPKPRLD